MADGVNNSLNVKLCNINGLASIYVQKMAHVQFLRGHVRLYLDHN